MGRRIKKHPWMLPAGLVAASAVVAISAVAAAALSGPRFYRCPDHLDAEACAVGDLLQRAGSAAQIDDNFVPWGMAVARRESKWDPSAVNYSDGPAACDLYESALSTYLRGNDYDSSRFCFGSGGLYGFIPATALKADGYQDADPYVIFNPKDATALLADFVNRIVEVYFPQLPPSARNWLSIRRAMASLTTMYDWREEGTRARDVRLRLAEDLAANGDDPNLMFASPQIGDYPGARAVRSELGSVFSNPAPPRPISLRPISLRPIRLTA